MTTPANSRNKQSPSDTPTHRPNDNGHKSIVRNESKQDYGKTPRSKSIAKQREEEEQPVNPIKTPPKEKGMESGKVQP